MFVAVAKLQNFSLDQQRHWHSLRICDFQFLNLWILTIFKIRKNLRGCFGAMFTSTVMPFLSKKKLRHQQNVMRSWEELVHTRLYPWQDWREEHWTRTLAMLSDLSWVKWTADTTDKLLTHCYDVVASCTQVIVMCYNVISKK